MAIAFGLGAVSYWLLGSMVVPWAFVLFAALIFLTGGNLQPVPVDLHRHFGRNSLP